MALETALEVGRQRLVAIWRERTLQELKKGKLKGEFQNL